MGHEETEPDDIYLLFMVIAAIAIGFYFIGPLIFNT